MPIQKLSINLLDQDVFSSSFIGKTLTWALSVGRYIVVFTELIVILSFLSRFKLDRELTDLNTETVKQQAIIESYGDLEDQVRFIQEQLELVKNQRDLTNPESYLDLITGSLPADVRLEKVQLEPDGFQLSAIALSNRGFSSFIRRLQKSPEIKSISLEQIENEEGSSGIVFRVKAEAMGSSSNSRREADGSSS